MWLVSVYVGVLVFSFLVFLRLSIISPSRTCGWINIFVGFGATFLNCIKYLKINSDFVTVNRCSFLHKIQYCEHAVVHKKFCLNIILWYVSQSEFYAAFTLYRCQKIALFSNRIICESPLNTTVAVVDLEYESIKMGRFSGIALLVAFLILI